jgi:flagellar hook-associated protein 3 FlgL
MRFVSNIASNVISDIQRSDETVQTALQQLSSGQRVTLPSDDPAASAAMVQLQTQASNIDQYTANADSAISQAQSADSVVSSVVSLLNQAVTLGTEGANGTSNAANRQAIATQVQGLLASVVSLANTKFQGISLFSGSANSQAAFTADSTSPTGYTYHGNSAVNTIAIGDSLSVQANIPGSTLFTNANGNVLAALSSLATALTSGTSDDIDIGTATAAVTTALKFVSQQHVVYGNAINQANAQESYLAQDQVTLTSRATSLIGIDTATAAENLSQAEINNSAVLAASARVLQNNLLTYLNP